MSKPISTFEKEMQNKAFRKKFEKAYKRFFMAENRLEAEEDSANEIKPSPRSLDDILEALPFERRAKIKVRADELIAQELKKRDS